MVPKGWDVKNLKDVTLKIQDGNYGAKYPKADELVDKGIPFLTSKALGGSGKTNPEKYDFITIEKHIELKKAHITTNDILFTNRGANVGVIGIAGEDLSDANIGPQLTLIRSNEKLVSYNYLYFFMKSSSFQRQVQGQDSGSAMNFFGIKSTEQFKIKVPPLQEQQKIAKILSTWDKAISTTERFIDNSTQQKKALMQQLLTGKKRLLDDEGKRFVGEWNKKTLAGICSKTISYGIVQTGEHVKDRVPCVRVVDLTQKTVSKNDMITTSDEINQSYNKTILESGEVMMALRGVVGLVRLVNEDLVGSNITRGLARLAPKNELIKSDFFLWILRSSYVKNELMRKVGGSALQEISLTALRKVQIPFPSLQEQQKIANVLTNADNEIELLEQQLSDLQQEKKALMQVLLTGKKRVLA